MVNQEDNRGNLLLYFTLEKRDELRKHYLEAVVNRSESFEIPSFPGYPFYTPYAGYLLEYLDSMYGVA